MATKKVKKVIKKENEDYLVEYAKQSGVEKLPSGVLYKVLKKGDGAKAKENSEVTIRYEGKTIDGKVFDSNMDGKPATFSPAQVVPGFGEALMNMPAGSKWEVCIPQALAYGDSEENPKIKPYSTLIFKIEVLKVGEAKPQQPMGDMPMFDEDAILQKAEGQQPEPQQPETQPAPESQPAPQPQQ